MASKSISVIDFFCGCGGTSAGLAAAGMKIIAALDVDKDASKTYRKNFPAVKFFTRKIEHFRPSMLIPVVESECDGPLLLSACAPCQPFSKQNRQKKEADDRKGLLRHLHRFVNRLNPDYIFLENVPGIQRVSNEEGPFADFLQLLEQRDYKYDFGVVESSWYGVPQVRRRLVLLASKSGEITLPQRTHGADCAEKPVNVWDVIRNLPPLAAGDTHPSVANHRAAHLSETNLRRIRATPEGGGRQNWPADLVLDCHKNYNGHTDVYGRLSKKKLAPALTTRCISLSNGRYGHPTQDRAISVREAACIQTFPMDFEFVGSLNSQARQIGNAVPVQLARAFGTHIIHFNNL